MTFVVPFDGSELARAALVRAREFGDALDEPVVAVTVVPESRRYAREKGWIGEDGEFDVRTVADALRDDATELAPDASFRSVRVDTSANAGTIARRIRGKARELGASVVFLGSENAGGIVVPVSSVGGTVASGDEYDVHIVRHGGPSGIETLR